MFYIRNRRTLKLILFHQQKESVTSNIMASSLLLKFTVTTIIGILLQKHSIIKSIQIPDIYWHPDNPLFNATLCRKGSREIFVREHDVMNIVCGNRDLNNGVREVAGVVSPKGYTYNVLVTQDSQLFENRRIQFDDHSSASSSSKDKQKARLLYICHEQKTKNNHRGVYTSMVNKYSVLFTPKQVSLGQFVFKSGNTYYFYTTSDGSEAGLATSQAPPSMRHMFLKVRVCGPYEDCKDERFRVNRCLQPMVAQPQVSDGLQRENLINNTTLPALLVLILLLGILIGVVSPCLWTHMKKRRQLNINSRKSEAGQKTTPISPSKGSKPVTIYNEDENLMSKEDQIIFKD